MTITKIFLDWSANDELAAINSRLTCGYGSRLVYYRGYDFHQDTVRGDYYIDFNRRVETTPDRLRDVPVRMTELVKHNSPVTAAVDGPYKDGNITARVETYIKNGVTQQSIQVTGHDGTTIEALNRWFDDLVDGKKADKNLRPISTISSRVVLRGHGGSGPSFRQVEIELSGVHNQVVADVAEVLAAHFGTLERIEQ